MSKLIFNGHSYTGGSINPNLATDVVYDNTDSGLAADDVQEAIDEVVCNRLTSENIKSTWISFSSTDYTITDDSLLTKVGNMIFVNINIQNKVAYNVDTAITLGTVASDYRPASAINTFCVSSKSQWATDPFTLGYCYLATNGNFIIQIKASSQKFVKISFAYSV